MESAEPWWRSAVVPDADGWADAELVAGDVPGPAPRRARAALQAWEATVHRRRAIAGRAP